MAVATINGVSKTIEESQSYSGVDTSVLIQMSKDYKKLLKTLTEKTSESNKITNELGYKIDEAFDMLSKRAKEVEELNERASKIYKNLNKLTKEQQEKVLEELKKDIAITFESYSNLTDEMKDFMIEFGKVSGAADFKRTFEEITKISNRVSEVIKYNKKILGRNETIDSARSKLKNDIMGDDSWSSGLRGVGKGALTGTIEHLSRSLGPFSAFLRPVGSFLSKEMPTIFSALGRKKRIISPTESVLRKEGVVGSAAIYIGDEIEKLKDQEENGGLLDLLTPDGLKVKLPSIQFPSSFTLGGIASSLLKGGFLAITIMGVADFIESFFTKDYEELEKNAYDAGYKDASNTIDLWNNSYVKYFGDFPEVLAGSVADALAEESFWRGIGTFVSSMLHRTDDRNKAYDQGVIVAGLESYAEESGKTYDELREEYNNDLLITRLNGDWDTFWEKWKDQSGVLEGVVGSPQMIITPEELEEMEKQAAEFDPSTLTAPTTTYDGNGNPPFTPPPLISGIMNITIFVFCVLDSKPEPNKYGNSPKYVSDDEL